MGFIRTFADGLANVVTGRGTSVDRATHNFWHSVTMQPQQIEAAYRTSWLTRQIVDIPAQDQTRAGRDWDADGEIIAKVEAEEKRLGYWAKVRQALIYGRLGGGALFINLGDDPAAPLPASIRPEQIVSLIPLYRGQLSIGPQIDDVLDPLFGEPSYFKLNTNRQPTIHASRLIIFKGQPVPGIGFTSASWEDRFWGDSVVQIVDDAVKNATTASSGFASLIDEAKVDVFFFDKLAETLAQSGGEERIRKRIDIATQEKSMHRSVSLDGGDRWETRTLNFAGAKDIITTYLSIVAGAADIPATRLLGKSPDGMNATGEGDLQNYYDSIAAQQDDDLRPQLERLDRVVLPSAGVLEELSWRFSPVRTLTAQQQAEVENKEADTLVKLVGTGLFDEAALEESYSNRLVESQRWPGYKEKRDEALASGDFEPGADDPSAIVPTQQGGGDPEGLAGTGGSSEPPRRAANDKVAAEGE